MNLDSIYRLIEETQTFRMQPSSGKPPGDGARPAPAPRDPSGSCWPPPGGRPPAAPSPEWDVREELRLRELEEVKARAAQMEKTMRWWSDCTANWREKWSKVRAERNSAREEGRQLRVRLEMTVKELSALRKKQGLPLGPGPEALGATGARDPARPGLGVLPCAQGDRAQMGSQTCESIRECLVKSEFPPEENTRGVEGGLILDPLRLNGKVKLCLDHPDLFENGGSENCAKKPGLRQQARHLPLENEVPETSALHLDEFQKILRKEREMRASLEKEIERLESAVSAWKQKYEELEESTSKNRRELNVLHGQHKNEVGGVSGGTEEGQNSQDCKDRQLSELRAELERLQVENTSERDQREILETEKQGLERENRSLKAQVKDMDELLRAKVGLNANSQGPDFKTSHIELQEKHKLDDFLRQIRELQRSLGEQKEAKDSVGTELSHTELSHNR